jgi:hypothetical protein
LEQLVAFTFRIKKIVFYVAHNFDFSELLNWLEIYKFLEAVFPKLFSKTPDNSVNKINYSRQEKSITVKAQYLHQTTSLFCVSEYYSNLSWNLRIFPIWFCSEESVPLTIASAGP